MILKDTFWSSRTTRWLPLLSLSSFSVFPDWLQTNTSSSVTASPMPPTSTFSPFFIPPSRSLFSSYHSVKYFLIGFSPWGPLSLGVAGEIRGYNFLQSAESGPRHPTPSPPLLPFRHTTTPFSQSSPWPGAEEHQQTRWETSLRSGVTFIFWSWGKHKPTQKKRGTNERIGPVCVSVCAEVERMKVRLKRMEKSGGKLKTKKKQWRRRSKTFNAQTYLHTWMWTSHTEAICHTWGDYAAEFPGLFSSVAAETSTSHPPPTQNTASLHLSALVWGLDSSKDAPVFHCLHKHAPILSRVPKAVQWTHDPITQTLIPLLWHCSACRRACLQSISFI